MIPYYGHGRYCPIKVYMKDKPDKFGMKVWGINDPDSGYLLQFKVYEGRGIGFPGKVIVGVIFGDWGKGCVGFSQVHS